MKHNYKFILVAIAAVILTYSACSKLKDDDGLGTKSTVSTKVVSAQMAHTLSEALYGSEGGFSITDGLDYPSNVVLKTKGKARIESASKFGCGFKIDTTFSLNLDLDTVKLDLWEKIKYELLCTNNKYSSVNLNDSLKLAVVGQGNNISETYGKRYVLKSLNPGVSNALLQLDGKLYLSVNGTYKEAGKTKAISAAFSYILAGLVINRTNDSDITAGTATFSTKGTYDKGTWDYKGTITFMAGHKAKLVINGDTYIINARTGMIQ